MAKKKTAYFCQECGNESPKWVGRCSACGAWNSMVEEVIVKDAVKAGGLSLGLSEGSAPMKIREVETDELPRMATGSAELDRVLGGGLLAGSLTLVVGDPGVGKSSMTIKICSELARTEGTILYVTGEESVRQVKMRAERLGALADDLYILSETNLDTIEAQTMKLQPRLLVIDSIQTVFRPDIESAPGSISQVRECAVQLLRIAKANSIAVILVGHVLKDGSLAGPRALEHIVDAVLYFEGDRNAQYRVLRAVKNRFGSTNEIGLFEMNSRGLVDVPDASKLFLSERPDDMPGSVVTASMEGTRPVLVEVQSLVSESQFMPPRRTSDNIDIKRIQLLLAVLEKRVGLRIGSSDVFVKVAGGIKVDEPAVDLAAAIALASSYRNRCVSAGIVVIGEVGLAGEVRAVAGVEVRIREASRMGFSTMILPKSNLKGLEKKNNIKLIGVETVAQALDAALE